MALSEESKIKIKNAYRSGKLTPEQQDFINRAIEQNQITITKEDELARQESIVQNMKTIDDISPIYLYSPFYIPVIIIAILFYLILKKKINKGWHRLCAFLSIFWTGIVIFDSAVLIDYYDYADALEEIPDNLKVMAFTALFPILTFTFLCWGIAWTKQGFKESK